MGQTAVVDDVSLAARRRTADRIFRGSLIFHLAVTLFWLYLVISQRHDLIVGEYNFDRGAIVRVLSGVMFFYVIWGFIWYGVKTALLKYWVGFTKEERRLAFSSRLREPFDVASFTARYSERRIRIVDMIGRRGRFATLAVSGFFYLYAQTATDPKPDFARGFLAENLFDALATNWIFLSFFYANGFLAAAFYGPQSRVMDGVLARANCLLITSLWAAFKFVLMPIGAALAARFPPDQFAVLFALIWGSYIMTDSFAEVGGALFGNQKIQVSGVGDVNRKSIAGTVTGFAAGLIFCLAIVTMQGLPTSWVVLALVISVSNTVLELYSPRGTDDFVMTVSNALWCLAFGVITR